MYTALQSNNQHNTMSVCCPKCNSKDVSRVNRNFLFKLCAPLLLIRKYICYKCLNKFYKTGGE
jgi:hypothetical protein